MKNLSTLAIVIAIPAVSILVLYIFAFPGDPTAYAILKAIGLAN